MSDLSTWTEEYKIGSFYINLRGRVGLYAMLNFIQDVGWMHATKAGSSLVRPYQ